MRPVYESQGGTGAEAASPRAGLFVTMAGRSLQIPASRLPTTECIVADSAHGNAVSGSMKWFFASTAPRPEFCIPTSIEIVRRMLTS